MKNKILTLWLLLTTLTACGQKKMGNKYFTWENFVEGFGKEMVLAENVFNNMFKNGLKENTLTKMDFPLAGASILLVPWAPIKNPARD